jgi:hypothetical protein
VKDSLALKLIMFIHEIREQRNKAITSRQVAALGRRANKTIPNF